MINGYLTNHALKRKKYRKPLSQGIMCSEIKKRHNVFMQVSRDRRTSNPKEKGNWKVDTFFSLQQCNSYVDHA
jgi:hypothetical protein